MQVLMWSLLQSGLAQRSVEQERLGSSLITSDVRWSTSWVIFGSFPTFLCSSLFQRERHFLGPLACAFLLCLANVCQQMEGWEGGGTTVFLPLSLSVSCGVSCSNCISSRVLITSKNPLLRWFHLPQGSLHWLQLLLEGSRFFGYQLPPFVPSVLVVIIAFCCCLPIS